MAFTLITAPAPRPEAVVDDDEEESTLVVGAAPGLAAAEAATAALLLLPLAVAGEAAVGWPGSPCCACSSVDGDEGSLRIEWSVSMSPALRKGVSMSGDGETGERAMDGWTHAGDIDVGQTANKQKEVAHRVALYIRLYIIQRNAITSYT